MNGTMVLVLIVHVKLYVGITSCKMDRNVIMGIKLGVLTVKLLQDIFAILHRFILPDRLVFQSVRWNPCLRLAM